MGSRAKMMKRNDRSAIPVVWVLTDDRPGNSTQSIGLAQALGWPYQVKELQFTPRARTLKKIFGPFAASCRVLDPARSAEIAPPWPDLIIATGWRPAQVAGGIRKRNQGGTRVIQLGRKGGHVAGLCDIAISCSYFRLPPHPRRIETIAPLTQVSPERLAETAERWRLLVTQARRPYVMALVGGVTKRHQWDSTIARRLGEDLRAFTQAQGGTVFVTTSRRTGMEAATALQEGLGDNANVHHWQPEQKDNPYLAYLALADVLVVTGESESMLAEAANVGKPVYIYPLPEIPAQGLK
ncbi:MAG: mitochondrial fission ELM1 family protein, partial [Candidatus Binatia bacterium]